MDKIPDKNQTTGSDASKLPHEVVWTIEDYSRRIFNTRLFDDRKKIVGELYDFMRSTATGGREEIGRVIWNSFGAGLGGPFEHAKGTVAYDHCMSVADAILAIRPIGSPASGAVGMREALQHYADTYCEGWCERSGDCAKFDHDCGGCKARSVLYSTPLVLGGDDIQTRRAQPELSGHDGSEAKSTPFSLRDHLQRQRAWSSKTFGPYPRVKGVLDHIRKELCEIEAKPSDLIEWIDVVILALDGAWRSGSTPEEIIDALVAKQTKNENREWPDWRASDPNKAIEHKRSIVERPFYPRGDAHPYGEV